jgi:PmbA protein
VPSGLRLDEDAVDDAAARSVPADGAGRRLERVALVREGRLVVPELERLPLVRPGIADAPRSGWLRLSWTSEAGRSDEELVGELGTGLLLERAVTESVDAASLSWTGQVEGWWVEDGVGRRAVARLPVTLDLPTLLSTVRAVGLESRMAHDSGTIRAVPWLLDGLPGETVGPAAGGPAPVSRPARPSAR